MFQTFHDVQRPVRVNGLLCRDRVEALQRVFEHELVHLLEMLIWFDPVARRRGSGDWPGAISATPPPEHDLITQGERASNRFGLRLGDRVTFVFEGVRRVGVVNRITRRATILVESAAGRSTPTASVTRSITFRWGSWKRPRRRGDRHAARPVYQPRRERGARRAAVRGPIREPPETNPPEPGRRRLRLARGRSGDAILPCRASCFHLILTRRGPRHGLEGRLLHRLARPDAGRWTYP